ncbi:ADAMTS-like protein 5 isoform X2 [Falco cherrug]|uniref:ADAMTS-like protein 5 isoform X2 n=1 Tax=Falco cherrug TaxID=345164 RepID=UPI0024784AC4|nr:ADAMTS-like protein 5 isoform X2 [Falco cherrug]
MRGGMAGWGVRGGSGGPHDAGCRWPWQLLLLAWLSLGCSVGTAQGPALGTLAGIPEPPAPAQPRRQLAPGAWGPWGPWTPCSSSCGDGVTVRTRRCLRSTEEEPCTGDPRQYRLCQLQGCPSGSVPFRAMQCSLYDNKPVLGTPVRYRWVPFHGAPNVCDLNCLAMGHNFYYTFGRVLDGTRCSPGSPDLCVGGRCLSVGCDGILGSGTRSDACGQCGGGHEMCLFVHRLFQGADPSSGYFGYMNVTTIPAGATHIKVTDKSRNYLALMTSDGRYVLNGDWSIAWPGPYEVAGTQLRYTRAPNGTESLEAPGPTDEDLHVMLCPCPCRSCCRSTTLASSTSSGCPAGTPSPAMVMPAPCGSPSPGGLGAPLPRSPWSPQPPCHCPSPGALPRSCHQEAPLAGAGTGLPQGDAGGAARPRDVLSASDTSARATSSSRAGSWRGAW